ncbi:hypothetical protein PAXINDRAFT_177946 [Paxillus involutus ATCC 200175]|nr:hypothetical protein PAXINDRAFT_177946 [Paxillus involutus ATCC 200175]
MTATGAHQTNSTHSVHALVRLLKSPTDPPSSPGPSKIDIARSAWSDPSFRAANKGEVIGDWVLTQLGHVGKARKDKDANSASHPIANPEYWTLLRDVLTTSPSAAARPIKAWLLPLLSRTPLNNIVTELFVLHSSQVHAPARAALAVLWPLAEKKMGVDALAECLGVTLGVCAEWEHADDDLAWICSAVLGSYKNALANAGNKKKIYTSFLTTHLPTWLRAVSSPESSHTLPHISYALPKGLQDTLYTAGTDTLFSLDALKQPLDTLFDALSSSPSSPLPVLSKLFASLLSAMHKCRSALFPAAASALSGREEVRKRGMEVIGRCWALVWGSVGVKKEREVEVWKFVVGLLEIVERERLFVANSFLGAGVGEDGEGERALVGARERVIGILETVGASVGDDRAEVVALSIQVLDVLVRIEYDLVGGVLGRVLAALVNIPPTLSHLTKDSTSALLTHLLEYHTKTRTVHTYALALLDAALCSHSYTAFTPSLPSLTNSFTIVSHLPSLARALRAFLTPTQSTTLGPAVLKGVEDAWAVYILLRDKDGSTDEREVKRRKLAGNDGSMDVEAGGGVVTGGEETEMALAQAFSHTGRMAGTILSNLPATAYVKDGELGLGSLWSDAGKLGWSIVWRCLREESATGAEQDKAKEKDGKKKKRKRADEAPSSSTLASTRNHTDDTVASAALRFLYDVRARVSSPLGDCDQLGEADLETLMRVARDEGTKPELVLEIIRTLLWHIWHTHTHEPGRLTQVQSILTTTITVLTTQFSPDSHWSGVSALLTRDNLGLAVLYLLMDRWIDVVDALASTENLEKLVSVLLSIPLGVVKDNHDEIHIQQDRTIITPRSILLDALRNAQFWELHNIRAVFLSSILTLTAPLSSYNLPTAASASLSYVAMPSPTDFARASDVYKLLLRVPPEYFTRPVRAELVKRAVGGNVGICAMLKDVKEKQSQGKSKKSDKSRSKTRRKSHVEDADDMVHDADVLAEEQECWTRRLAFLRIFLQRMGQSMNTSGSAAFIGHLLSPPSGLSSPSEIVKSVTLDLIELHFIALLRSQDPEAASSASSAIATIIATRPFSQPDSQETWTHALVQSSVLRLIECLREDFILASLPDEVVRGLGMLHEALVSALLPHVNSFLERDPTAEEFPSSRQINAWSHVLSFTQWLGIKGKHLINISILTQAKAVAAEPAVARFGLKLASTILRGGASDRLGVEVCSSVFALLFEELRCTLDLSHSTHLDLVVAFYSVNGGDRGSEMERALGTHVAQASKLSVDDFSHLLDIVAEGIGGSGLQACQRERLIHLSMTLLHDAPRGTLKVIQSFATRCFNLFSGQAEMYGGSSQLKAHYLEFIAKHCSDRPTAIRSVDLGSIWSLLNKMLSGSPEHDKATSFPIFYHIVTIIGALLRLRRDLVVHTLPHLSLVLRQLMMITRSIRPQLGAKQSKIVTDTFPSWISSSQPLAADEGRALARLLTTLTTKTVPRAYTHPPTESQKPESLAKPFAKHAGYVLIAYIDALNDPLCVMTTEMRRELETGLFALCEMVGEHSRDAVMMSALDSGGKTIMKALWKEYEKQRYVGKG